MPPGFPTRARLLVWSRSSCVERFFLLSAFDISSERYPISCRLLPPSRALRTNLGPEAMVAPLRAPCAVVTHIPVAVVQQNLPSSNPLLRVSQIFSVLGEISPRLSVVTLPDEAIFSRTPALLWALQSFFSKWLPSGLLGLQATPEAIVSQTADSVAPRCVGGVVTASEIGRASCRERV